MTSDSTEKSQTQPEEDQAVTNPPSDESSTPAEGRTIRIGSQRSSVDLQKSRPQRSDSEKSTADLPQEQKPQLQKKGPDKPAVEPLSADPSETNQQDSIVAVPASSPVPQARATEVVQPPQTSRSPVAIPKISDELEREIDEALGDMSLDQMMSAEADIGGEILEADTRRMGTVIKVHRDDVFFNIGTRNEGVASLKQFKESPEIGISMDVVITGFNAEEGLYELVIPGAAVNVGDWDDVSEGLVVEANVTGSNTGGLECQVGNLRGFIPTSQISLYRVENIAEFVGQKLQCVITEANPQRQNLVLSHRAVLERQREESREEFLNQLEVGQLREGTVRSLRDFGAFVDIGGIDGLIHISKMSWDRINHPSEVLKEGQAIKVKVEKIDRQTGKIGLSYRDTLENPWATVEQKYPVSGIVQGTVTRIAKFGAFVKLEPGVEGLIHISELAHHRVNLVSSIVQEGQTVEVKVVSVDPSEQRIGLSLKATLAAPQGEKADEASEEHEASGEMTVPRSNKPLKGGFDRPSGGEKFGLRW